MTTVNQIILTCHFSIHMAFVEAGVGQAQGLGLVYVLDCLGNKLILLGSDLFCFFS